MNGKAIIRPYGPPDKNAVIALLKLLVPSYFAEEEVADLSRYLDDERELYFVTERSGIILGAAGINFEKDKGIGKLSWDFVHPQEHGKGLGKALLDHRLQLLLAMPDIQSITVRTSQLAFRFYENNGFEVVDIQADYWAPGFDLYRMVFNKMHAEQPK